MIVMKFGGSSLADGPRIERVCAIVRDRVAHSPLIVVSALGDTTDRLTEAAVAGPTCGVPVLEELRGQTVATAEAALGQVAANDFRADLDRIFEEALAALRRIEDVVGMPPPSAAMDALLAVGERVSSALMSRALRANGVESAFLDSRQLFVTESTRGGAVALAGPTRDRLRQLVAPVLKAGQVPVIGGFIASDADGVTTVLGRGSSDYTASLSGACLDAEEVQIWTDVDGVMTADPSIVRSVRSLPVLSPIEASELAYFGARVLHPSTMLPAIEHGVPVRVLNSQRPQGEGTLILQDPPPSDDMVKSIAYKEDITLLDVRSTRMLMAHGFLARIFAIFDEHETAVDMVSTSEVSVSLTIDRPERIPAIVAELEEFAEVSHESGKAIVCVVGEGIQYTSGIAARVFSAVRKIRIRMASVGASRVNFGFVVDEKDLEYAVKSLHATFFEEVGTCHE